MPLVVGKKARAKGVQSGKWNPCACFADTDAPSPLCSPATVAAMSGGGWESLALVAASIMVMRTACRPHRERPVDMELQCVHYCPRVLQAFMVVQYMVIRVAVKSLSERLVDTHAVKS